MDFYTVATLEDALATIERLGAGARVLAGGTDLGVQLQRGEVEPEALVYIGRLQELASVCDNGREMELGALLTHRALADCVALAGRYEAIRTAAASVGGWQTQAIGTLGGNVCNASPAADLLPPLLAHGARVTLASARAGERQLPIERFVLGRRRTALVPGELLTRIRLEAPPPRTADVYLKIGRRGAMEVAIVGLALRLTLAEDLQTVAEVRIAVCAAGPVPWSAAGAGSILAGSRLGDDALGAAGEALVAEAATIDDARAPAAYRRRVLPRMLARALHMCAQRVQVEGRAQQGAER